MKKVLTGLFCLLTVNSFAGGSASSEYILKLLSVETQKTLLKTFDLADQGECLRMGRHTGRGGERVLPCSIEGTMKGTDITYTIELDSEGIDIKGYIYSIIRTNI
jgi:hypothetical protein